MINLHINPPLSPFLVRHRNLPHNPVDIQVVSRADNLVVNHLLFRLIDHFPNLPCSRPHNLRSNLRHSHRFNLLLNRIDSHLVSQLVVLVVRLNNPVFNHFHIRPCSRRGNQWRFHPPSHHIDHLRYRADIQADNQVVSRVDNHLPNLPCNHPDGCMEVWEDGRSKSWEASPHNLR